MRALVALFTYLSVGTVIAAMILGGYVWSNGYLEKSRVALAIAALRGIEPPPPKAEKITKPEETSEQPTLDDREQSRAVASRHLELREQAVARGLERIQFESLRLQDERASYDILREAFTKELTLRTDEAKARGKENIRLIWETIKPKQAKEQILQMVETGAKDDVVEILTAMPIAKRAKIIAEFRSEEEVRKLDDLLQMIRQGLPETEVIDKARQQVNSLAPPQK